jgi:hypothetical protein
MMNERSYASLSSGLLARKGTARPAMRPQGYTGFEDLGWNDMGQAPDAPVYVEEDEADEAGHRVPSSIAALTPLPRGDEPSVVAQQRAIAESFDREIEDEPHEDDAPETPVRAQKKRRAIPADVVPLPKRKAVPAGRKAAFTLRLDAERHLKLRLACAVTGRSAQQIVTGALDDLLASIPEIDTLAARVPAKSGKRG